MVSQRTRAPREVEKFRELARNVMRSAPPRAPVIDEWNFFCEGGNLNFTVTWRDTATDETGYRLFRNGEAIVELPANSTTYTDVYDIPADQNVEYYIQAYSPTGSANTSIMRMRCGT